MTGRGGPRWWDLVLFAVLTGSVAYAASVLIVVPGWAGQLLWLPVPVFAATTVWLVMTVRAEGEARRAQSYADRITGRPER